MNKTGRLTRKQEQAIAALLSSPTIEEAAKSSGIGRTTIFKFLQNETFRDAYREARGQVVRQAITQAQGACSEAVEVLKEIMNDKQSPSSTRVAAARTILETSVKAVELEEIITRIERIEKKIENKK